MLKPKTKKFNARQTEDAKQRFSIRKYSFGATSVLLGFSFMLMGAGSVSADTTTPAQTSTELVANAASSRSAQTTSESTENRTKNDAESTAAATTSTESAAAETDATSTETQAPSTTANEAASQTEKKSSADSTSSGSSSTETTDSSTTEAKGSTDSSATSARTESTDQAVATIASQSTENEKAAATNPVSATAEETKDKIAARTKQTSTNENTDKAAATSSSDRLVQGKSLTLSSKEIGYTSATGETTGTGSSITATVSFTGEVGDKFTLKVPTNALGEDMSVLYDINTYSKASIADTTVTKENLAGYYYITSVLKEAGSLTQNFLFTSVKSRMSTIWRDTMVDSDSIGSREMRMILSAEDADGNDLG